MKWALETSVRPQILANDVNFHMRYCLFFTTKRFTDEVVNKQRNIYKAFKFVSVVKNL